MPWPWRRQGGGGVCVSAGAFTLPRSVPPAPSLGPPASTLRTRFPDPAQSLSLRGQGTWDPASSQAFHLRWRGSEAFTAYDPWRLLPPSGCRGEDWGEIHCCFKAWSSQLVAVVRALELCRTQPLTCLSAFLAGPKGLGEGCNSPLPAVSIPESLLADCWWNGSSNHHVLSLAC